MICTTNFEIRPWYPYIRFRPLRMLKHFWQRRTRGFDESELWYLDWHLAEHILPRLKAFKELSRSSLPLYNEVVRLDDETDEEFEQRCDDIWNATIDKMIYAFDCIVNEDKDLPELPTGKRVKDIEHEKYGALYRICYTEEEQQQVDEYFLAQTNRQYKINEGLMLFSRYFHKLWD